MLLVVADGEKNVIKNGIFCHLSVTRAAKFQTTWVSQPPIGSLSHAFDNSLTVTGNRRTKTVLSWQLLATLDFQEYFRLGRSRAVVNLIPIAVCNKIYVLLLKVKARSEV